MPARGGPEIDTVDVIVLAGGGRAPEYDAVAVAAEAVAGLEYDLLLRAQALNLSGVPMPGTLSCTKSIRSPGAMLNPSNCDGSAPASPPALSFQRNPVRSMVFVPKLESSQKSGPWGTPNKLLVEAEDMTSVMASWAKTAPPILIRWQC